MKQRDIIIDALQRERQGYVNRGLDARVALVDAELAQLGVMASRPRRKAAAADKADSAETAAKASAPVEKAARRKSGS